MGEVQCQLPPRAKFQNRKRVGALNSALSLGQQHLGRHISQAEGQAHEHYVQDGPQLSNMSTYYQRLIEQCAGDKLKRSKRRRLQDELHLQS
jgi:hypothetical protein